ncbi:MAG: zinc and cadmium transporter [Candidatus Saccharimonadales bacterium]|jgi:zinc and cadmium transporter
MSSLIQVIFFSLIGGVFSLIGGFLLLSNKKRARHLAEYATPFAAGALLAAAFVDLLREAAHAGDIDKALMSALVGILVFFLLERFLRWFHHHHDHEDESHDPTASLIIVGDTLHNFIDGIAIAAGFLVSPSTGIVVTLAVAAHEIPQEIGDFGLLLKKGLSRSKVIWANIISALATTVAAIIFFQLGQSSDIPLDIVLGLVAGFFIYIAVSDIIPSIHASEKKNIVGWHSALLIIGAILVSVVTISLHGYIDQGNDNDHEHGASSETEEHGHGIYDHEDHETLPTLELLIEEDAKSGWNIELETTNYTFSPESVNGENMPNEGHAHLYVNGEKITRLYSSYYHLVNLKGGDEVMVTLNANDHGEYAHDGETIEATATVNDEHDDF